MKGELRVGQEYSYERLITEEDIRRFAELSGDRGRHHLETDEKGRLLAHGLLTATVPTKLGGDLDFIAREMHFEFAGPVYAGDKLRCAAVVKSLKDRPLRVKVSMAFTVHNQDGALVLKGSTSGHISKAGSLRHSEGGAGEDPQADRPRTVRDTTAEYDGAEP